MSSPSTRLTHPPLLRRELSLSRSVALVVSNMIGTGIFITTGYLAGDLGRPMLVLGIWVVGLLIALAGCLSYAELSVNLPRSGGEYVYLQEAWGPAAGFLSGWVSFFAGFSAPIAAGALAISEYLGQAFPWLSTGTPREMLHGTLRLNRGVWISVGIIAVFAVVNILGLRGAARLQSFLTALKVGVLGVFVLLALTVGRGHWANLNLATTRTSSHGIAAQFAVSLIFVMFAYSGWNAASYVAEEVKDVKRTLPLALVLGTVIVGLLYCALNVAFLYALPLESLKGVVPVGATTARALFGVRAGNAFSGVMALALLSCVSAMCIVGPRVYYAMAQDGCFPGAAARVHPIWRTPVRAIIYQALASVIMVLTAKFESLIYYIGFTLVLFSALAVVGLLRLRNRPGWYRLSAVSWCYPVIPLAFVLASLWMLSWTLATRPRDSALGLLTVACGGLFYRWIVRRRTVSLHIQ